MITYKDAYNYFISSSKSKLDELTSSRVGLLLDINNLYDLLESKKEDLASCNVVANNRKIDLYYFESLKDIVSTKQIVNSEDILIIHTNVRRRFIYDNTDLTFLIRDYINYFLNLIEKIVEIDKTIPIYEERLTISLMLFKSILSTINFEASKYILEYGYSFNLGYKVGSLSITKKKRQFVTPHREEDYFANKVNWGESLKELEHIAETECEDSKKLLKSYKDRYINKYEFIKAMKKYSYDKDTNPNGKKWIIYFVDDTTYWWHWGKHACFIPNKTAYAFVPTNYVNATNGVRSQLEFIKTVTSVDDILNTDKLGMRDKLFAIVKYSKLIPLNYKEYAVQEN